MTIKKTVFRIVVAAMVAFSLYGCASQSVKTQCNADSLMAINRGLDSVYTELKKSYDTFIPSEMDNALAGLNKYLATASQTLGSMQVVSDCMPLKDAIVKKVATMSSIATNESKEQVRIYKIPDTDFTDELRAEWDKISAQVAQKMEYANNEVAKAQQEIKNQQK
ncbi:MAG: hypothetical protein K6F33_05455 [Bacteroidales bacterium]|nr:hypothetical protein [Bacteroidales bacterium]